MMEAVEQEVEMAEDGGVDKKTEESQNAKDIDLLTFEGKI